jgi:xanthine dehydrogenase accessory factor
MNEIFDALESCLDRGEDAVLATVVETRGSVYRREGAKTLLRPDGGMIGTISGGCLDADLRERSSDVRRDRRPRLVRYDTWAMSDEVFGFGLGCGGEMEIWLEPLDWWRSDDGVLARRRLRAAFDLGETLVVSTTLRRGDRVLDRIERAIDDVSATTRSVKLASAGEEIFVDRIEPPRRIFVLGTGSDVEPFVKLAREIGFEITVLTDGPDVRSRFSDVTVLEALAGDLRAIEFRGRPAIVLMTHKSAVDREALRSLLPRADRLLYLGILGPRARTQRLLRELEEDGIQPVPGSIGVIHGPAGLDVGSETPAEIALSILAEILAARGQRPAGRLRDKGPRDPSGA